ncbi:GMC oxidoreductase [Multifurca ochricompacta]|uniref:GMC oxidoreductase n=1 Tax=Multifurca ochricompacta TaxID=376703 RepID=A0AAD4QKX1_9AGAM|nr:GMC oxidoreductase [Multifurca ochricompacta]
MGSSHSYLSDPTSFATEVKGKNEDSNSWKAYDYVIVGEVCTAGSVLAARLSEDPNVTVLLIEAGTSHEKQFLTQIPLAWPKILKSSIDWDYQTVTQPRAGNRQHDVPRGKVLGGSSAINALIYQHYFAEWESLGATGWGYKDLYPYFIKSEEYTPHLGHPRVASSNHGSSGLWKTGYVDAAPIHNVVIDACEELGVKRIDDFNTENGQMAPPPTRSYFANLDNIISGNSIAVAYLSPDVLRRHNLTVAVTTVVEKILFDGSDLEPRAIGVEVSKSSSSPKYRIKANREVIISGGAIATPHILLLSGLGPKGELSKVGIKVVRDLPQVGKNYYDHLSSGPICLRGKPGYTLDFLNSPIQAVFAMLQWLLFNKGPMTNLTAPGAAFVRVDDEKLPYSSKSASGVPVRANKTGPNTPDLEIVWFPLVIGGFGVQTPPGVYGTTVGPVLLKPESSGTITLKSASVYDKPVIDPNFLASENDLNVLVRGVRFSQRIGRTKRVDGILEPRSDSTDTKDFFYMGDADPDRITDEEIKEFIRGHCSAAFHPTCRRLELRVFGVKGLRVVDASVFPNQISGHPVAVVVAIAEKAVDIIKADATS